MCVPMAIRITHSESFYDDPPTIQVANQSIVYREWLMNYP